MGGIDHDHVAFRLDQRHGAGITVFAHAGGRGDAQAAALVLAAVGIFLRLLDVLDRDQADAAIGIVHHDDLLDAVLVQQPLGFVGLHAFAHRDQLVLGHQLGDLLARIGGKAHVAVGEDAHQLAGALGVRALHHRHAGDVMPLHQRQRIGQGRARPDGHRIDHHAAFEALHPAHMLGLFLDAQILVDHAHAAGLGHGDGKARLGDGVHGGGDQRNAQLDRLGQAGAGIDLAGKDFGGAGHQQDIVEGQGFADGRAGRS